jgi:hypothetical protein
VKHLLPALLALLVGCADAPARPTPDRLDLVVHDARLGDLCRELSERSGQTIRCDFPFAGPVTLDLHGVTLEAALDAATKQLGLRFLDLGEGSIEVVRPDPLKHAFVWAPRAKIIEELARDAHVTVVLAPDVTGLSSLSVDYEGTVADAARVLHDFLGREGLSSLRVGELLVVSRAPLDLDVPPFGDSTRGSFWARNAPADAWFEALERATGRRVEHGPAPISLGPLYASDDSAVRVSVLLSYLPRPAKQLADLPPVAVLPSGRVIPWDLQGWAKGPRGGPFVVNGRAFAFGEEIIPGVKSDDPDNYNRIHAFLDEGVWLIENGITFVPLGGH